MSAARNERRRLKRFYPDVWKAGALAACGIKTGLPGGYPQGFHGWPLDKRNAYFAAFNQAYTDLHGSPPADEASDG
jgi:hypothetical protein